MMRKLLKGVVMSVAASCVFIAGPAEAKIKCKNGAQIVNGSLIVTPYCQDNYLAKVAREYGQRVSARSIRNNPHVKRDVCLLIGHDTRVHAACAASGFDIHQRGVH